MSDSTKSKSSKIEPYNPQLYDLIHKGNNGDLEFYLRACQGASRVLELGCGSGRIAIALSRLGLNVTGIDNHPGMLDQARSHVRDLGDDVAAKLQLVEGTMEDVSLGEKFDRVIIPYNGLFCLANDREMLNCFESARNLLADNGLFIFDVYNVSEELHEELLELTDDDTPYAEDEPEPIVSIVENASRIDVFESYRWQPHKQLALASYRYVTTRDESSEEETHTIRHHYLTEKQLTALLCRAGFEVMDIRIGFEEDSSDDAEQLIVVARPKKWRP